MTQKRWFMLLFFTVIATQVALLYPGFAAGTLVKISGGYTPIENLQVGDFFYSITPQRTYKLSQVTHTTNYALPKAIKIITVNDIISAAPNQKFYLPHSQKWLSAKKNHTIWHSNMLTTEDLLRKRNLLSQQLINQIKNKIQQQRSTQETDAVSLAKRKQNAASNAIKDSFKNNSPQQTPNIKGPDKDPDDWFEKLKKNYAKKGRTKQFGNIYKDPKSGYWWSRACGGERAHTGHHYKVFKETARGLEWIFDANKLGQTILEKHKSPIGKFIPYSEIIFY